MTEPLVDVYEQLDVYDDPIWLPADVFTLACAIAAAAVLGWVAFAFARDARPGHNRER